jgi:hypothetical protein
MRHLTQDELVLLYYGELSGPDWEQAKAHLRVCDLCREELLSLESALKAVEALPVPERGEDYGREVWARISPRLEAKVERRPRFFLPLRVWVFAGSVAVLLVVAFWSGRWWQQRRTDTETAISASAQRRILMLAVADHLERAQMLLVEVMHQEAGSPSESSRTAQLAEDLVQSNRLYRQAALRDGEPGLANVLDELERILLEISHSSGATLADDLAMLQHQIESEGILFKVRVVELEAREKQTAETAQPVGSIL